LDRKTLAAAFKTTLPVLMGYMAIGMAFGLMLEAVGYNVIWAFFMSLTIYAGSGQYLGVQLLHTGEGLVQVALMTLVINFRHVVYGLSMLEKFRGLGIRKIYMIFALTDETYALLSSTEAPKGIDAKKFYFYVAALDHSYWIAGSVIGCVAGYLIRINIQGIEFAMTAMFIVIAMEQWKSSRSHLPVAIGAVGALASLFLAGSERMLIPAIFVIVTLLLCLRGKLEEKVSPREEEMKS